jgi:hypothetical protein
MAKKTFEVVLRVELETDGKTLPTSADAYDVVAEALGIYSKSATVCTAQVIDSRLDDVNVVDDLTVEE